jgi:hypothetical protein
MMLFQKKFARELIALFMLLGFSLSPSIATAQKKEKSEKKEEKAATAQGTPVLWREPTDIASLDLFLGPGGDAMKPDLSHVTFVKDEPGGYSVKFRVRDGAGNTWVAKLGNEAQTETAAVRLVWAVGYVTEINYLAPCVQIEGAPKPRKKVAMCEGGGFANVRFEARPKEIKRLEDWSWKNNPFVGTNEFQGLLVLMALLNNWDLKDTNNKVLLVPAKNTETQDTNNTSDSANKSDAEQKPDAGQKQNELQYIISDLGATFGKTGNAITHNRNQPETFIKTKFLKKVEGDKVLFDYHGKDSGLFRNITVEQAKWIGDLLSRLSDQQISDAFRAANYSPQEIQILTESVRARINELVNLSAPQTAHNN